MPAQSLIQPTSRSALKRLSRYAATIVAAIALALGMVASVTNFAAAVQPPRVTPSGPLTDYAVVQVELTGLIPGYAYRVGICDGPYRGDLPSCDYDPEFSRTFFTDNTSETLSFPVRKSYKTRSDGPTITCGGTTGAVCYMVVIQYGEQEYNNETRVRFR